MILIVAVITTAGPRSDQWPYLALAWTLSQSSDHLHQVSSNCTPIKTFGHPRQSGVGKLIGDMSDRLMGEDHAGGTASQPV
ncbi:hypothetical protein SCA6_004687 [Theobroma cacao]